jgi:hypothetical protein
MSCALPDTEPPYPLQIRRPGDPAPGESFSWLLGLAQDDDGVTAEDRAVLVAADPVYVGVALAGVSVRGVHRHLLAIRGHSLRVAHEASGPGIRDGAEIGDVGANGPGGSDADVPGRGGRARHDIAVVGDEVQPGIVPVSARPTRSSAAPPKSGPTSSPIVGFAAASSADITWMLRCPMWRFFDASHGGPESGSAAARHSGPPTQPVGVWAVRSLLDLVQRVPARTPAIPGGRVDPVTAAAVRETVEKSATRPELLAIRVGAAGPRRAAAAGVARQIVDGYVLASRSLIPVRLRHAAAVIAGRGARRREWLLMSATELGVLAHLPADPARYRFTTAALHRPHPNTAYLAEREPPTAGSSGWTHEGWTSVPDRPATAERGRGDPWGGDDRAQP